MRSWISLVVVWAVVPGVALAEPYWVEWTGDAFPETDGWTRYSSDPPAERWLEDGSLFIDSRADWFITEEYGQPRPGEMTPGPGERFVMVWRVKVREIIGSAAPGVAVWSDDQHAVSLDMGMDFIEDPHDGTAASFAPNQWHEFALRTEDMLSYELYIDGALGMEGEFYESYFPLAGAYWGDKTSHRALSEWNYVGFGMVPEPASLLGFILLHMVWLTKRSSAR